MEEVQRDGVITSMEEGGWAVTGARESEKVVKSES